MTSATWWHAALSVMQLNLPEQTWLATREWKKFAVLVLPLVLPGGSGEPDPEWKRSGDP